MSDGPTREEIDAKLGKIGAETDAKIARVEGKIDLVLAKLDSVGERIGAVRDDNRSTRANQWVIGTALAVLIVALAFGVPAIFGNGLQLRDAVHSEVQDMLVHQQPPAPPASGKH